MEIDPFEERWGEPRGPVPRVLRDRPVKPVKPLSTLKASKRSSAIALSARMERLSLAARRIPRARAYPTLRQAQALYDWPQWLAAVAVELQMLREMGCYDRVDLSQVNWPSVPDHPNKNGPSIEI